MGSCLIPAGPFTSQIQPFLLVDPVHALMVGLEAFSSQSRIDAP